MIFKRKGVDLTVFFATFLSYAIHFMLEPIMEPTGKSLVGINMMITLLLSLYLIDMCNFEDIILFSLTKMMTYLVGLFLICLVYTAEEKGMIGVVTQDFLLFLVVILMSKLDSAIYEECLR